MLKKYTYLSLTIATCSWLFLSGCSGSKPAEESAADSLTSDTTAVSAAVDDVPPPMENKMWDDSLKKYFTPEQVVVVKNSWMEFNRIKSARELAHSYNETLKNLVSLVNDRIRVSDPDVSSGDDSPRRHWAWFAEYFPAIRFAQVDCSECSFDASIDVSTMVSKAAQTPEPEDNLFFDIVAESQGNTYQLIGCDFCAASLTGDGRSLRILKKIEAAVPVATPLFGDQISDYRLHVLTVNDEHYYYDKKTVLAEINNLLKSPILTAQEKQQLQTVRDGLSSGTLAAQFDCGGSGNCTWPEL